MFKQQGQLVFSPSDLTRYLESPFVSWMARLYVEDREHCPDKDPADPLTQSLAAKGYAHEDALEAYFRDQGCTVLKIEGDTAQDKFAQTLSAMESGADVIVQGRLELDDFAGFSDFLVRVEGDSKFGDYHYEIWDTKLASKVKPTFLVQLCCYAEMLESIQGRRPETVTVALGSGVQERFRTLDYFSFYQSLKQSFLEFQQNWSVEGMPDPADSSDWGDWSTYAKSLLLERDHLSQVATISKGQIKKLEAAGIHTMQALSTSDLEAIPGLQSGLYQRLKAQAQIQCETRTRQASDTDTKPAYRIIKHAEGVKEGLALLPPPSPLDIFFDIEGFPLDTGGLEYLWGSTFFDGNTRLFKDFWAHNADQEKEAFQAFIRWAYGRWLEDPSMHIYHYANYEIAACRKLMGRYGVCEFEVDQLLRNEVFVDLYKIVKGGVLLGEPRYSIKNVEHLYRGKRETLVGNGGDSVVVYEEWRTRNQQGLEGDTWETSEILKSIRDYNIDDCNSTQELVDWLRAEQTHHAIAYLGQKEATEPELSEEINERTKLRDRLLERAQREKEQDNPHHSLTENLAWVLEFHRREAKPVFWKHFDRLGMNPLDLMDDLDCIACCERTERDPFKATPRTKQLSYEYRFDLAQEFKGAKENFYVVGLESDDGKSVRAKFIKDESDLDSGLIVVQSKDELPGIISLVPDEYVRPDPIPAAIYDVVKRYESGELKIGETAILDFLTRSKPRFITSYKKSGEGSKIAPSNEPKERLDQIIEAALNLDSSYLTIQGPPGAGKSYTGKHLIAEMLKRGLKVGISSNSHKAINNLLISTAKYCQSEGINGTFVCTNNSDPELEALGVTVTANNALSGKVEPSAVLGTTAWGYCRDDMVDMLDYLFIDEAGQVSIANLVGMSRCAKNLILMGDQMQLGQPSQGSHPEESGLSILDYLLHQTPTIPDDMGVFLGTTYRMHSQVNGFISDHIYEGKLESHPSADLRYIAWPSEDTSRSSSINKEAGIVFVPVEHHGNSQASEEEAERIVELVDELLGREYHTGNPSQPTRPITLDDMLFVAPYNHQVAKLRQRLGDEAKIGSVDKFQGQEAPIVFLSMCASDPNDSPRGIEFLFDRNRINVAISRAKCLAIVVASPTLGLCNPSNTEQLKLINLFSALSS